MSTRVHFLRDAALVFAAGHDSGRHAHRALQLTQGLEAPFRFQLGDGAWHTASFFAFAPDQLHRVVAEGRIAYLFVDRGPRAWAQWSATQAAQPPGVECVAKLREASAASPGAATIEALVHAWEDVSLPGFRAREPLVDARLAAVLAAIERAPAAPTNHRALAQAAHLSTSRFAERFRAATGMPVRNYLLWRRLLHAVELLQAGQSATGAAHAAGFSDAAHLSRSFRRILGAAPSQLIAREPAAPR